MRVSTVFFCISIRKLPPKIEVRGYTFAGVSFNAFFVCERAVSAAWPAAVRACSNSSPTRPISAALAGLVCRADPDTRRAPTLREAGIVRGMGGALVLCHGGDERSAWAAEARSGVMLHR